MNSQPRPKSIGTLLWEVLRLGAKTFWESHANPVRPVIERQQALSLLGLPPTASAEQIKKRYRTLAKKHHPDRGGDPQQMQRIIAAYELLMKDIQR